MGRVSCREWGGHEQIVEVGLQNGLEAEIREGLAAGDQVIMHPGDDVVDGTTIRQRD